MNVAEQLLDLEPAIREISKQGAEFQGRVASLTKSATGSFAADVVTEADYWVQRQLLELFLDRGLHACQLVAEENTPELAPLIARFAPEATEHLFIDPIDGTKRFVEGLPYFSTIVSVREGDRMLYSYCYYPRLDWWIRLVGDECYEISGTVPLEIPAQERTVVYTSGTAEEDFGDWYGELTGWRWSKGDSLHPCGSKLLYLSGSVAGYACSKPNLYDGLMIYHYARIRRHACRAETPGSGARLAMTAWESSPRGLQLAGRYLCLQPSLAS